MASMRFSPDKCPNCHGEPHGTYEHVPGLCRIKRNDDGTFDYQGDTELWWDDQYTYEDPNGDILLWCPNCCELWHAKKLPTEEVTEQAPTESPRARVVVVCEGGLIQSVLSDSPNVAVYSIDYDAKHVAIDDDMDRVFDIPQDCGTDPEGTETAMAFGGREQVEVNAARVDQIIAALDKSRAEKAAETQPPKIIPFTVALKIGDVEATTPEEAASKFALQLRRFLDGDDFERHHLEIEVSDDDWSKTLIINKDGREI